MKRTALTLLLGLAVGTVAYQGYYRTNEPAAADSLEGQLAWMKTELQLTDTQFARIRELHEASSPRLHALASQVGQLQTEFAEFEKARQTSDRVDFLEFARFVETRRTINHECLDSTRRLIVAAAEVMTPQQRQHYIRLVATAEPFALSLLN